MLLKRFELGQRDQNVKRGQGKLVTVYCIDEHVASSLPEQKVIPEWSFGLLQMHE